MHIVGCADGAIRSDRRSARGADGLWLQIECWPNPHFVSGTVVRRTTAIPIRRKDNRPFAFGSRNRPASRPSQTEQGCGVRADRSLGDWATTDPIRMFPAEETYVLTVQAALVHGAEASHPRPLVIEVVLKRDSLETQATSCLKFGARQRPRHLAKLVGCVPCPRDHK